MSVELTPQGSRGVKTPPGPLKGMFVRSQLLLIVSASAAGLTSSRSCC